MTDEKLVYEVRTSNRGMPIDDILKIAKDLVYKPEEVYVEPGNASMWFQFVFPAKYLYEEMDEQIEDDIIATIHKYCRYEFSPLDIHHFNYKIYTNL